MQDEKNICDTVLILLIYLVIACAFLALELGLLPSKQDEPAPQTETTTTSTTTTAPTTTTTTAPAPALYYPLTAEERDIVERVVMAEAGGESYEGQMAVAQCILNASTLHDLRPDEAVEEFKYTGWRPDPTEEVKQAVAAVFDDGATVFDRDVLYFYAPALCRSKWHESQVYVTTIGGHKFFKEARE